MKKEMKKKRRQKLLKNSYKSMGIFLLFIINMLAGNVCTRLWANEVTIVGVEFSLKKNNQYDFVVTLLHEDSGWDHYANKWEIRTLDDKVLGTRILAHPHVNEQPFTRSLSGVQIPANITQVKIVAFDLLHGQSDDRVVILKK